MFSRSVPITGKKGHEGLKLVSRRNATQISVWDIPSGKTGLPFRCSVALGNFPLKRPKKSCSIQSSQLTLALRTTRYNGHPDNIDSSWIPGKNKLLTFVWNKVQLLRTLANEDTNSRSLQCPPYLFNRILRKQVANGEQPMMLAGPNGDLLDLALC